MYSIGNCYLLFHGLVCTVAPFPPSMWLTLMKTFQQDASFCLYQGNTSLLFQFSEPWNELNSVSRTPVPKSHTYGHQRETNKFVVFLVKVCTCSWSDSCGVQTRKVFVYAHLLTICFNKMEVTLFWNLLFWSHILSELDKELSIREASNVALGHMICLMNKLHNEHIRTGNYRTKPVELI